MVGIAQLVRAPGCGPGGRGFKSRYSPFPKDSQKGYQGTPFKNEMPNRYLLVWLFSCNCRNTISWLCTAHRRFGDQVGRRDFLLELVTHSVHSVVLRRC